MPEYILGTDSSIVALSTNPDETTVTIAPPLDILTRVIGPLEFYKYKWSGSDAVERVPNIYATINPDRLDIVESLEVTFQTKSSDTLVQVFTYDPPLVGAKRYDGTSLVPLTPAEISELADIDARATPLTEAEFRALLSDTEKQDLDDFANSALSAGDKKIVQSFLKDMSIRPEFLIDEPVIATGISDLETTTLIAAGRSDEINNLEPSDPPKIGTGLFSGLALAVDNSYVDIPFNKGVYKSDLTSPLLAADLTLTFNQNAGAATNVVISSITKTDNTEESAASALVGGEKTIRIFLTVTGIPDGQEDIEIAPTTNASIYGKAGGTATTTETTGVLLINDVTAIVPEVLSVELAPNNAYFDVTFNTGMYHSDGSSPLSNANFSGAFDQNGGTTTGFNFGSVRKPDNIVEGSATPTAGGEKTVRIFINLVGGDPDGVELAGIQIPVNAIANQYGTQNPATIPAELMTLYPPVRPIIIRGAMAGNNAYMDVFFNVGVYAADGSSPIVATSAFTETFSQNGGTATNTVIFSGKKPNSAIEANASALVGGENIVRLFLTVTGTPNGLETFKVSAPIVYTSAQKLANAVQSTGPIRLFST